MDNHFTHVDAAGNARMVDVGEKAGTHRSAVAVSHAFCASCNRARVTSTGLLKPCLCYGEGTDLRALLRGGAGDAALEQAMAATIYEKPRSHCFGTGPITEQHVMAAIGG